MLAAINPQNTSLVTKYPVCHSQGELLYLIGKNDIKEVFIDKDLPGNLSIETFINVLKTKYPDVEISVIEPYITVDAEVIADTIVHPKNNTLRIAVLVALIQTLFSITIQYSTLTPRHVIYTVIAGIATVIFFYGGMQCLKNINQ